MSRTNDVPKNNKIDDLPIIPPLNDRQKDRIDNPNSNPPVAKCGECGLILQQTMGYVCTHKYCPVQLKITS